MSDLIQLKRSSVANAAPTTLADGELALNFRDGKLYYRNHTGAIVEFAGGGGGEDTTLRAFFLPPAPTSLTASAANAQVSLSWTAPTVLAQTPITDYVVQYSSNSGSTWTTFSDGTSTATSATVTGLTNGTAYVFRVAAVNGVGTGTYSSATSSVTPVAFTPSSVAGLRVWLDSSVSSSMYDATSGGSVVSNGNAVARWNDLSGNSNHFVQSNSTYRPILTSTGLACAENTSRFMSSDLSQTTNAMSVFIVATLTARNSGLNRYGRFFSASNGSNHDYASNDGILLGDDVSIVQVYRNSGSVVSTTAATINQRVVVGFTLNGGDVTLYRNASTSSGTTSTTSMNSTVMRIGESGTPAADSGLAGVFHEVAIYNAAIGSTDASQLVSYLMTKWGIS